MKKARGIKFAKSFAILFPELQFIGPFVVAQEQIIRRNLAVTATTAMMARAKRRTKLSAVLAATRTRFATRALPVTVQIAEAAGRFRARKKLNCRVMTVTHSPMAATAVVSVATLVARDFAS